jgi:hypothetical protein
MQVRELLKSYFQVGDGLDKFFLGLLVVNVSAFYYYGIAWNCSHENCGGITGSAFWFAANFWPFLLHFVFWMRNESEEFSGFVLF